MPQIASEIIDVYTMLDGLNTIKSGVRIGPSELRDCQNIRYFPVGGFKWRMGYDDLNSTAITAEPACTGLYMARFSSGTNVAFLTAGTGFYKMDALDGTWDNIGGSLTLSSGQNVVFNFAILNDVLIACNNTNTTVQVSSALSASEIGGGVPFTSALFPVEHRGYMFYGNPVVSGTREPDRIYFSDINTPATVGTNNYIDVAKKQGGDVRGAVEYDGRLYVFKRHGIYAIEYQPTRVNSSGTLFPFIEVPNPIVPGVGTQSHRSIVKFTTPATHKTPGQELVFFVDQFGMPRIFDGSTTLAIGTPIRDSRDSGITSLAALDTSRIQYCWAVNNPTENLIYVSMTSSAGNSQNDVVWVLDYTTGFSWSRDRYFHNFNCGALFEKNDGSFAPYFGNYAGKVYEMETGTNDAGMAISSYAVSGDLYVKSPVVRSNWPAIELRGTTGDEDESITIEYYIDGEDNPSKTDTVILFKSGLTEWEENSDDDAEFIWDETDWAKSGLVTKTREIDVQAKTLRVRFSNTTLDNRATIEGYSLFVRPQGWAQE